MENKQHIKTPWPELNDIEQISRQEIPHASGAICVEFIFRTPDGQEHCLSHFCVEGEEIPQTIQDAIGEVGQIMPMVPGGEC